MKSKSIVYLFLYVFLVLLVVSPDSYIHDLYGHFDSAVFLYYGKAMMNGLVPYIDFNEAKGPLLFLIYGIGYLISNHDFIGVFWISVLSYCIVYLYTYRISKIFLKSGKASMFVTILMTVFYFNPLVHYEIKCEDFGLVFITVSLYYICKQLYEHRSSHINIVAFVLGVSFSACCLLKINMGAMIGVFILFGLVDAFKHKYILRYMLYGIGGIGIVLTPFVIYFYLNDAFPQCISDFYYVMTFTIGNYSANTSYWGRLSVFFLEHVVLMVFITTLVGIVIFYIKNKQYGAFPIVSFLCIFFITLQAGAFHYYYTVCSPFYIFGLCALALLIENKKYKLWIVAFTVFVLVSVSNLMRCWIGFKTEDLFIQNTERRQTFYKYAYIIAQIEKPTIILDGYLQGWDIPSNVIPGCKYSLAINGEPMVVTESRIEAIKKGVDFVEVGREAQNIISELEKCGYKRYDFGSPLVLYTKHAVKTPSDNFYVSSLDVLLKRDVLADIRNE